MTGLRRASALVAFGLGILLLLAALATLVAAWTLPAQSMEDLGRVVMAMLLAAASAIPFGAAIAIGHASMPRWMLAASVAGLCLAIIPAIAFVGAALRS